MKYMLNTVMQNTFDAVNDNANFERKQEARKKLDFYYDKQLDYLKEYLYDTFSDPSSYKIATLNITRKVIDGLSQVYAKPVRRRTSNSTDQDLFDKIQAESAWSLKLKQANRLSKLLGFVLIRPVYRNGKINLDIITSDLVDAETGGSPEDIQAITIAYYPETSRDELYFLRWTPETIQRLNYKGQVTSELDNPYQTIPFVPVWAEMPLDTFYVDSGDSLISVQEMINTKIFELSYTLSLQGFSVPYVVGAQNELGVLDPGHCLNLPKDSEFGFASPGNAVSSVLESLDYLIRTTCMAYGLPASYISSRPSERKSGTARQIENLELREKRNEDINLFGKYEKDLFEIVKVIQNTHGNKKFGDSHLKVKFGDIQLAASPEDQATQWQQYLEMGLTNPIDILMEMDPDLTKEEAEQKYQQNKSYASSGEKGE
jgi:hypothetical protein